MIQVRREKGSPVNITDLVSSGVNRHIVEELWYHFHFTEELK